MYGFLGLKAGSRTCAKDVRDKAMQISFRPSAARRGRAEGNRIRPELPLTRSAKIMRRLLKARELGLPEGDVSTLDSAMT